MEIQPGSKKYRTNYINYLSMNEINKKNKVHFHFRRFVLILAFLSGVMVLLQQSCKKEEECIPPVIDSITFEGSTVRVDYLIPTRKITVHGAHLDGATKIKINNLTYDATYLYHPDTTLTFTVPYIESNLTVPDSLTIFKSCGEAVVEVKILSAPAFISKISNEFAVAGETITLKGNYFVDLEKVIFPGEIPGEIVEGYNDTICRIVVPEGVENAGKLVLTSASGDGSSAYNIDFNNTTGLLCDFDYNNFWAGWGGDIIRNADDATIPPARGFFYVCELSNIMPGTTEIENSMLPIAFHVSPDYSGDLTPDYFAIQAEMYVKYPWKTGYYNILIGRKSLTTGQIEYSYEYDYKPWSDTINYRGQFITDGWETVTIPLTKFTLSGSSDIPLQSYSQLRLANYMLWSFVNPEEEEGGKPLTHFKVAIDNLRLEQIKEE